MAGLEVRLQSGWKTYWRSAGSTGLPPAIDIEGSDNVAAAILSYPAPERFVAFGIEALGYSDEVTFPLAVERADPSRGGRLTLAADLLVCGTVCIPGRFEFDVAIPADAAFLPPVEETPIADALSKVPIPATRQDIALSRLAATPEGLRVDVETSTGVLTDLAGALVVAEVEDADPLMGILRATTDGPLSAVLVGPRPVEPDTPVRLTVVGETTAIDLSGTVAAALAPGLPAPQWIDSTPDAVGAPAVEWNAGQPEPKTSAWFILGLAFLGGLILNVMPCVLPVLSIKLAAMSRASGLERHQRQLAFVATAAGILAFMATVALALGVLHALVATCSGACSSRSRSS